MFDMKCVFEYWGKMGLYRLETFKKNVYSYKYIQNERKNFLNFFFLNFVMKPLILVITYYRLLPIIQPWLRIVLSKEILYNFFKNQYKYLLSAVSYPTSDVPLTCRLFSLYLYGLVFVYTHDTHLTVITNGKLCHSRCNNIKTKSTETVNSGLSY